MREHLQSSVSRVMILAPLFLSRGASRADPATPSDDFRWMHGANYVASYAATDVEMCLRYDRTAIERELGYAHKLGLNILSPDAI